MYICVCVLVRFDHTHKSIQGVFPDSAQVTICVLRIKMQVALCKAIALIPVMFLKPDKYISYTVITN